jgi:nitrogen regulatory protein P-II 1
MKTITVIAEHVSPEALNAALPEDGVISVTVDEARSFSRTATSVQSYRGVKIGRHFTPVFRIEILADDAAVDRVVEGIAFARGAGLLGEADVRVSADTIVNVLATSRALAA